MAVIGITCVYREEESFVKLAFDYIRAVEKAGGLPVPVAFLGKEKLLDLLDMIDGLVLSGGGDMDPCYYNEEPLLGHGEISPLRDKIEYELTRLALQKEKPVLAICRGMQVLNIAAGGNIYQHLGLLKDALEHMQKAPRSYPFHEIEIYPGTVLWNITGKVKNLRVNSFHQQALKDLATGFRTCAVSNDGVIEAMESSIRPFALGVQWHPEALSSEGHPGGQEIFDAFLEAAKRDKRP